MPTFFLIFIVGIFSGVVSGMIGGGSGLVLMPIQLLLGIDPKIATTTTHFGFIGVSLGSLARFNQERAIRHKYIIPLIIISLLSGIIGPYLQFAINGRELQKIISILIIFCVPLFLLRKSVGSTHRESTLLMQAIGYIALILIFTLQVAVGAATGIMAILSSVSFLGLSMIETSAILRFPNLISSVIAIAIYAKHGQVNYEYGGILLIAMVIGGYVGSHIAVKGGEKFVKYAFSVFAIILATVLLYK